MSTDRNMLAETRDSLLALAGRISAHLGEAPVEPRPDPVPTPIVPPPASIDYGDPKHNVDDPRKLTGYMGYFGVYPNGLPEGWDWGKWAETWGRQNPEQRADVGPPVDKSGFDLGEGISRRNKAISGQAQTFRFRVKPNARTVELSVAVVPGRGRFSVVTDSGPGFSNHEFRIGGSIGQHKPLAQVAPNTLPEGEYKYTVTVDPQEPGREVWLDVNFRQS